jgi:hypothetical protein
LLTPSKTTSCVKQSPWNQKQQAPSLSTSDSSKLEFIKAVLRKLQDMTAHIGAERR